MPDRPRMLKAAAEGITVTDSHERNPVTGDGMPAAQRSIVDPSKQLRPATTRGTFTSQFVIADDQGAAPPDSDSDPSKRGRRRPSDARIRMFHNPRKVVGVVEEAAEPTAPSNKCIKLLQQSDWATIEGRFTRKRQVQPAYRESRSVLAWAKLNGGVPNNTCYISDCPMIRRAAARDPRQSPIIGDAAAREKLADTDVPVEPVDASEELVDDSCSPRDATADDYDHCYDGDDDDDDDVETYHARVDRRRSA